MNAPVKDIKAAVTTGPLPASTKIFAIPEAAPDLRVPLREIQLQAGANEPNVVLYDTSGPYTDPNVVIDVEKGLSRARAAWVLERGGVEAYEGREVKPEDNGNAGKHLARAFPIHNQPLRGVGDAPITQYEFARAGIITKEMIYVAERENLGRKAKLEGADATIADGESYRPPATIDDPAVLAEIEESLRQLGYGRSD